MELSRENIRNAAQHARNIANTYLRTAEMASLHEIAAMLDAVANIQSENRFLKQIIKNQYELLTKERDNNEQTNSKRPEDGTAEQT